MFDPQVLARPGTVLLDTARVDRGNALSWCFVGPERILTADRPRQVPGLLQTIQDVVDGGQYVAGYLSYEAGYPFVDLNPPSDIEKPVAWFGVYQRRWPLVPASVDRGLRSLTGSISVDEPKLRVGREEYTDAVEMVRQHIQAGDVYQINYTAPVDFRMQGDPRLFYRRLRGHQHVPYGAYVNVGSRQILSYSPELFVRRGGDHVLTRPMKGTTRRGRTLDEDRELRNVLTHDPKNRAENLMIVDLLRNDLSKCCKVGSVQVPELFTAESYDTVTQMTSTVEGQLRTDQTTDAVLRALFPCGSVTGAPKRRAMALIRSLEKGPRGVYCGAIGMIGPDDTAVFNVAIRTVVLEEDRGRMGVGSGIVWDSDPESEYEECTLKTQFLTPSMTSRQTDPSDGECRLIETMRYDGIQVPLLDRHVSRLAESAAYFEYPFDPDRFRRRVERAVRAVDMDTVCKVRTTLDRWGRIEVETTPLSSSREEPWRLTFAEERVDRSDPFFYHKTTHRRVYDRALESARDEGFDEALLLNEEGQLTEGTHSSLFVERDDHLWTPPLDCGLLPGVYREYVLETQDRARERVLTVEDIQNADALYCCNAVRGWCRAVVEDEPIPIS